MNPRSKATRNQGQGVRYGRGIRTPRRPSSGVTRPRVQHAAPTGVARRTA